MTLTTHTVIAAAITKSFLRAHPLLAFLAAFASHFAADAVPHWDYAARSLSEERHDHQEYGILRQPSFGTDIVHTALDAVIGLLILLLVMRPASWHGLLGVGIIVVGADLPDFLQGVYYTKKADFLKPLQNFHERIHTRIRLGHYPLLGIPFQLAILFLALIFLS